MAACPRCRGQAFQGRCKPCLILSKRSLLHGGSLRGPPIPPASGRRQYEGIENGDLELCFKTAAGKCILSARNQPARQRFFSFLPPGRLSLTIHITAGGYLLFSNLPNIFF